MKLKSGTVLYQIILFVNTLSNHLTSTFDNGSDSKNSKSNNKYIKIQASLNQGFTFY